MRAEGLELRVSSSEFMVQFGVQGLVFRVWGGGFCVEGSKV